MECKELREIIDENQKNARLKDKKETNLEEELKNDQV
jgi:hypothetical protein